MWGEKLDDISLLKAHSGSGKNASDHTQYAEHPHYPNWNMKIGKSSEVNKRSDEERSSKENPALRPLAGPYRVAAIRAHRSATNYATFRQRKLIPLWPRIRSTGAQICRSPNVFTAPRTIQFRPHVIQRPQRGRAALL